MDSVGGGAEGLAAAAQPRLLIPVVLALGYNRWNLLFAESYGVHLQLLPMLVRFFEEDESAVTADYRRLQSSRLNGGYALS